MRRTFARAIALICLLAPAVEAQRAKFPTMPPGPVIKIGSTTYQPSMIIWSGVTPSLSGSTLTLTIGGGAPVPSTRTLTFSSPLMCDGGGSCDLSVNRNIGILNQSANLVLAGPTSGGAAAPSFRALIAADIPTLTISKLSDLTLANVYTAGSSTAHSELTLTNARGGLVLNIAGSAGSGSGSGLTYHLNQACAFSLLDRTLLDAGTGGSPRPLFCVTPSGQLLGRTITGVKHEFDFVGDADAVLRIADSTSIEGGDLVLYAGKGAAGFRGGTTRIYGGDLGAGGPLGGGVVMDSAANPDGAAGNVGVQDCAAATGDIQIGACNAKRIMVGHRGMTFGTLLHGTTLYLESQPSGQWHLRNSGGTIAFDAINVNPDGASFNPQIKGYDQLLLTTARPSVSTYEFEINRAGAVPAFRLKRTDGTPVILFSADDDDVSGGETVLGTGTITLKKTGTQYGQITQVAGNGTKITSNGNYFQLAGNVGAWLAQTAGGRGFNCDDTIPICTMAGDFRSTTAGGNSFGTTTNPWGSGAFNHYASGGSAPSATPGTGAGANGTCSVSGTDAAGTITITTANTDTPAGSADICTITFAVAYGAAPRVVVMASNDATWNLASGVWRYRQTDTVAGSFKIRSGAIALPALTTATYTLNYHVTQ